MINYFFEDVNPFVVSISISKNLERIIITENKKLGKISFVLCDDAYLLKINQTFLNHDYYTDIITFDYAKGKTISGDIFVSLPRISENASLLNKHLDVEFHRVLIHGILHLCGYKDKSEEEIIEMRNKEDFYLNFF